MSVQWMDDFKGYGNSAAPGTGVMLDGTPWLDHGNLSTTDRLEEDPDPNATGNVYRVQSQSGSSNYGDNPRLALTTPATKVGIACRYWLPSLPASSSLSQSIHVMTTGNGMIYHWSIRPNGSIRLYRGTTSGSRVLVADTVAPVIFAGSWNHLELWIDTVTGEYWAAKEGVEIATLTGTDGSPPSTVIGIVSWAYSEPGAGSGEDLFIKDLIIMDGNGTENNEPYMGPVTLYRLNPIADVSGAWTASTGSDKFAMVDEDTVSDTDYISADDTLPAAQIFEMEDLPSDVVSVRAVMSMVRQRKTDGGDGKVQITMSTNGADDVGADNAITTAFSYYWDVSEVSPDTAAPWTPTEVNEMTVTADRTL